MEQFVTGYGLPGAVILALVGVLLWVVRKFFAGDVVSRKVHEDRMADRDETILFQRQTIKELTAATQDFAVGNYTAAHALRSVTNAEPPKDGDES